jgi:hypothetical protein
MIKSLVALTTLLLPCLAYADQSAPPSVQVVPAGSGPIAPLAAQAAGFTTLAPTSRKNCRQIGLAVAQMVQMGLPNRLRARPQIIESTFDRVRYMVYNQTEYRMLWG